MGAGHSHGSPPAGRRPWGEPQPAPWRRLLIRVRQAFGAGRANGAPGLRELPLSLRHGVIAAAYLAAASGEDHPRAAELAVDAMERGAAAGEWWQADVWAHRALWHFEQAQQTLDAVRQARRIGDLRAAAGDPASARRYYAEAIDEARDIGAEHEQGLAALGLGRSLLELGEVTAARRLAAASIDLLRRAEAPAGELDAARALLGTEVAVGERTEEGG